jgi:23S rRNA pseudouridine2605 synthase
VSPAQPMNLVVYLARAGVGSRRSCDDLIREGVVTVNDEVVTFPRQKVTPEDVVAVRGEPVSARELRYFLVNKPRGVASTRSDPHADRVIVDMVPGGRALFPVGRLDVDTTGLIILTNDGVLANRLMHPRYGVPKTYVARVRGKVSRRALGTLRQGVDLEDGPTSPADVKLKKQSAKTALVEITIHEGRKRQVRRMFTSVGLPVEELSRRRYGPLTDKGLEPGGYRELTGDEVESLRRAGEEVAGEVAKEVEGSPLMLAAEVDAEAAPLTAEAALLADATAVAEQGEPQPFDAGAGVGGGTDVSDETDEREAPPEESGHPDAAAEPSGEPDEAQADDET